MSGKKPKTRVIEAGAFRFVQKREGYRWEVDRNESTVVLPASAGKTPTLHYEISLTGMHEMYRERLRSEYRIFDWEPWKSRRGELDPVAAAYIEALQSIENLQVMREGKVDQDLLIVAGMNLGRALERVSAQQVWATRNPPRQANETRKDRVNARRNALADYIAEKGERPEKRPGSWYEGFREKHRKEHPEHVASDKTLKDDYPYAIAIVRKRTKKDSTKRS
jgi:hypothetical protein